MTVQDIDFTFPLSMTDLPTSVSVTNNESYALVLDRIETIPASATVTIALSDPWEERRLARWKSILRAKNSGVLTVNSFNDLWGTLRLKNLTGSVQFVSSYFLPLQPNEIRDVPTGTLTTTSAARIRMWKEIQEAITGSNISLETTPSSDTPTVTAVSPDLLDLAGGPMIIAGTDFVPTATVTVDGVAATNVVWLNATTITVTAPITSAGAKTVAVTNSVGHTGSLASAVTYTAATFGSIAPTSGTHLGGTPVTITGTGFYTGAVAAIEGVAITGQVIVSSTSITGVSPAGSAGAQNVTVTNPGTGGSVATGSGAFTYT